MRLLLDSHTLLWWDSDLDRLSPAQHDALSDPDNTIFVSAVTAWELGIKRASGRLALVQSIEALSARFGFVELTITMRHGQYAASLPPVHKDPFDRMLVAQALVEDLILVTADRRFSEYQVTIL